ncbi:FAD-dependent oxidoreductase, partial [Nocardia cyriacigeorgica]
MDVARRTVEIADGGAVDLLEYDTLLYALGSTAADHGVPGVAEHAFHVAARPSALRLRARLAELGEGGKVLVVGGNLTAIEAATEIAEAHP